MSTGIEVVVGVLLSAGVGFFCCQAVRAHREQTEATERIAERQRQHRSWREAGRQRERGVAAAVRSKFRRISLLRHGDALTGSVRPASAVAAAATTAPEDIDVEAQPCEKRSCGPAEGAKSDTSSQRGNLADPPGMSAREKKVRWFSRVTYANSDGDGPGGEGGPRSEGGPLSNIRPAGSIAAGAVDGDSGSTKRGPRFPFRRSGSGEEAKQEEPVDASSVAHLSCAICLERFGATAGEVLPLPPLREIPEDGGATPGEAATAAPAGAHACSGGGDGGGSGAVSAEAAAPAHRSDVMVLPCGHAFHELCLDPWINESKLCPMCKQNVEALATEQTSAAAKSRRGYRRANTAP